MGRTGSTSLAIALLDNDPFALRQISALITHACRDATVFWTTGNPAHAIQHCLYDERKPGILVVDMALDGLAGDEVCRLIRRQSQTIALLCVTSYPPDL